MTYGVLPAAAPAMAIVGDKTLVAFVIVWATTPPTITRPAMEPSTTFMVGAGRAGRMVG